MTEAELRMAMHAATIVSAGGVDAVVVGFAFADGGETTAYCVRVRDGELEMDGRCEMKLEDVIAKGDECGERLECGGSCWKQRGHDPPHFCPGDFDGEPGSCPA